MERMFKIVTKSIRFDNFKDTIKLWFFGDLHRFTSSCDEHRWKVFLQDAKRTHDKNTYYFGLGDYCDFASTREQKALKSEMHEQTIVDFDEIVKKRNRVLAMEMSFMKPNLLGLIDGNHGWVFKDGKTGTEDLAERLGSEYLGWLCYYTLKFNLNPKVGGRKINSVDIFACHGRAGGKTAGISINQVDDMRNISPSADIYIMGHDHQRFARPISILDPSWDGSGQRHLNSKRQLLCRGGSFKKAYVPDTACYEVGRLLRPADLGALLLEINFRRESKNGDRVVTDIKAII